MVDNRNSLSKFISGVYLWMFLGLIVSGITGYVTSKSYGMLRFVSNNMFIIIITELIVVIAFSALQRKVSPLVAKILFILYAFISGLTLSAIFLVYTKQSLIMIFVSAALMFGLLSLYGYTTNTNLDGLGKMLIFGLIAIIIVSIINMFVNSSGLNITLSIVSVVIFLGLTAYDMQKLKSIYNYYGKNENELSKASIYGALNLYLDFINIFLELLQLFGKRND